jgi:flagellin-specific chaperone FliS
MKGEELNSTINLINSTLTKVNNLLDFGVEQSPEIIEGLDKVLDILTSIQSKLEYERGNEIGPTKDFYLENILKSK